MNAGSVQLSKWARAKIALKPAAWSKLIVPTILGQIVGLGDAVDVRFHVLGFVFAVAAVSFIVLLNDYADEKVDLIKSELYQSSAKKTIIDGVVAKKRVLLAGSAAGLFALGLGWLAESLGRSGFFSITFFGLLFFVAYSLPPLRLNYRGGGELLEFLAVGFLLPWWNAWLIAGTSWTEDFIMFLPYLPFASAMAIASGLSDEVSDRKGGKRTVVTTFGNEAGKYAIQFSLGIGAAAWLSISVFAEPIAMAFFIAAGLYTFYQLRMASKLSPRAKTEAFPSIRAYKTHVRSAAHRGALIAAAGLFLSRYFSDLVK